MAAIALTAGISTAGGGALFASPNTDVTIGGYPIAVVGTKVASHGTAPHTTSTCTQGSSTVTIGGRGIVRAGDLTTCGHPVVGGSSDVSIP
jgi:uncharacterized Zn-binding protein involved in type VI secretion